MYKILYSKQSVKDIKKLQRSNLANKAKLLIETIKKTPLINYPPYEKLIGDLLGAYSRRINKQHRLIYSIDEENKIIKVHRMWSHYE